MSFFTREVESHRGLTISRKHPKTDNIDHDLDHEVPLYFVRIGETSTYVWRNGKTGKGTTPTGIDEASKNIEDWEGYFLSIEDAKTAIDKYRETHPEVQST